MTLTQAEKAVRAAQRRKKRARHGDKQTALLRLRDAVTAALACAAKNKQEALL